MNTLTEQEDSACGGTQRAMQKAIHLWHGGSAQDRREGGFTPQVFEQILATTKAIRLDLGLKMLKQNKGLYMVTNDGQTKCQEHPMKEEIQIGERRLELSPLLCE
jgi:hypothetical protein